MLFASVSSTTLLKQRRKASQKKLHTVIEWLAGYNEKNYSNLLIKKQPLKNSLRRNANAGPITCVICRYSIEEIKKQLTQEVRYLDKLADELANGRRMEKILRVA